MRLEKPRIEIKRGALDRLGRRLANERTMRLARQFIIRCKDTILKDLVVQEMDDHPGDPDV